MAVLVVGSVGIDAVQTPAVSRTELMGGSAVYFSFAASFYTRVLFVGNAGEDYPERFREVLAARDIDLTGLAIEPGKTFRWSGRYRENMIDRDTLETQLNVFGSFNPVLPDAYRECPYVFLANGLPTLQEKVLAQMRRRPKFVAADTMDLWIRTARPDLDRLLGRIDALIVNDAEARMMTGKASLTEAGAAILAQGPRLVIIKKGEHGVMLIGPGGSFLLPAFPVASVVDPTGAGDTFAGALMGHLASTDDLSPENLRRAVVHGAVVASFTVEGFSVEGLRAIARRDIEERYGKLAQLTKVPERP